jgi:hypothetical protein
VLCHMGGNATIWSWHHLSHGCRSNNTVYGNVSACRLKQLIQ